ESRPAPLNVGGIHDTHPVSFAPRHRLRAPENLRDIRDGPGSLEDHGDIALADRIALGDENLAYDPSPRREQRDFHLHRLKDDQRVVLGDAVADRDLDFPDRAGDLAAHLEFRHRGMISRLANPPASNRAGARSATPAFAPYADHDRTDHRHDLA